MSDLFDELIDDQKKKEGYYNIALIGNNGNRDSGKITLALAYAAALEFLASHKKTPVLWVGRRYRTEEWVVQSFLPSQGETKGRVEILSHTFTNLRDILRLDRAQQAEVLVLDALTRSDDESSGDGAAAFAWAGHWQQETRHSCIVPWGIRAPANRTGRVSFEEDTDE